MPVGTEVKVTGRVQSRNYEKKYEDGTVEQRVAYEVSVSNLEVEVPFKWALFFFFFCNITVTNIDFCAKKKYNRRRLLPGGNYGWSYSRNIR